MTGLLGGALTRAMVEQVAGRPLQSPPGLLASERPGDRDRHHLFLVEEGASRPFALVKWARAAEADNLRREQEALARVRACKDPLIARSCPESWGPVEAGHGTILTIERVLQGRGAYAALRTSLWPRPVAAEHFLRVDNWLSHFVAATRQPPVELTSALLEEEIEAPLAEYLARLDPSPMAAQGVRSAIDTAKAHLGRSFSPTAEHGDLWVSNLLVPDRGSGLYVVDWEYFRPCALPGFDLLFFCTTYAMETPWRPYGWASPAAAIRRAYVESTWLSALIKDLLESCCAASDLPRSMVPALLPVALARTALRQRDAGADRDSNSPRAWVEALRAWWARPASSWLDTWSARNVSSRS